ncbi:hypothetical protein GCM10010423_37920 [Streptomyces levis]|uniref:Uncharacterized protein n=1 Tax=Streptomyces levis TaxID=285566 RepID=A0ABP6B4E9_9ACTN
MYLPACATAAAGGGRPGEPGAALVINKPVSGQRPLPDTGQGLCAGVTEDPRTRDMCDRKRVFVTQPGQRRTPERRRGTLTRPGEADRGPGPKTTQEKDQGMPKALS